MLTIRCVLSCSVSHPYRGGFSCLRFVSLDSAPISELLKSYSTFFCDEMNICCPSTWATILLCYIKSQKIHPPPVRPSRTQQERVAPSFILLNWIMVVSCSDKISLLSAPLPVLCGNHQRCRGCFSYVVFFHVSQLRWQMEGNFG